MGKSNRKKKLLRRKNYNPPGKRLVNRGGNQYGFEHLMLGEYPDEGMWLIQQIYDFYNEIDDPYTDNDRWALVGQFRSGGPVRRDRQEGMLRIRRQGGHPSQVRQHLQDRIQLWTLRESESGTFWGTF